MRVWKHGCPKMKNDAKEVNYWLDYWKERFSWRKLDDKGIIRSPDVGFNATVLSYFDVTETCMCGKSQQAQTRSQRIPIEPLMGILRHPNYPCGGYKFMSNKDYIYSLFIHELFPTVQRTPRCSRKYLFDLGASSYSNGPGGASQSWFVETYTAQGIEFDQILAWEGKPQDPNKLLAEYPSGVYEKLSYFNVLAVTDPLAPGNPLSILKRVARIEDFVVLKVDIDNIAVEMEFIERILKDVELSNLIDELYFEDHVTAHPLEFNGWGPDSIMHYKRNITESYDVFTQLRERGIRAHSWV
jgi:hypothetical protein